jgi:two-component system phosphate regulon response regulator PhoB
MLSVDEKAHRVFVNGHEVHVSALEMRLILHLMRAPGRMCTRRVLLTEVWGYHPDVSSRTVDTHVKRLRDKLGAAAQMLQTVRGIGFRLAEPDEERSAGPMDGEENESSAGSRQGAPAERRSPR